MICFKCEINERLSYCAYCESCRKSYRRQYYLDNKDHELRKWRDYCKNFPDRVRDSDYKSRFGITIDDYNLMLKNQGDVCAACKMAETARNPHNLDETRRLSVDHCHKSKKVRGLLCNRCNTILGLAQDSAPILESLIGYLNK